MKPFDAQAALNGAPVVTRDGREVTQIAHFHIDHTERFAGVIDGETLTVWKKDGRFLSAHTDSKTDLFMAPTKKTGWVARYSDNTMGNGMSDTEAGCKIINPRAVSFHKIEWEE